MFMEVKRINIRFTIVNIEMLAMGIFAALTVVGVLDFSGSYGDMNKGIIVVLVILVLAILASITILNQISKRLKVPMQELKQSASGLAEGKIDIDLVKHDDDEVGDVVDEFQKMIENIKMQAQIAQSIAEGNLAVNVSPSSKEDVLGNALYRLVETNNATLTGIRESSVQLTAGAGQVASASQALAQGSTEQASAIEQITASMEEIARKRLTL